MRVSYCDDYWVPLPEKHPFPMGKFPALHRILLEEGLIDSPRIAAPDQASWEDLRLAHTPAYLAKLAEGGLSDLEQKRMRLPWSPRLVYRSRIAARGTTNAARWALADGIAANLAGGTHHSFADRGEGFCVLNDVAVAVRVLQHEEHIRRALIVDLDVHQGNGTASIFEHDDRVYTFSMHGERNYPLKKSRSSRDVGVDDRLTDEPYLDLLARHLPEVIDASRADLLVYVAGVDPAEGDRYGRLCLTRQGLFERDRLVLEAAKQHGMPILLVLGGGYAATPHETADLHAITHRAARSVFGGLASSTSHHVPAR